ncbi:hypothetical protein LINGRAHAP2_LOCUS27661 [Linum grandiflorum]
MKNVDADILLIRCFVPFVQLIQNPVSIS